MISINSEFIGMHAEIVESSNREIIGLSGKIIDETKSTFTLQTKNGIKVIPKEHNAWNLGNAQVINGSLISKRPEDRIKVKV